MEDESPPPPPLYLCDMFLRLPFAAAVAVARVDERRGEWRRGEKPSARQ